MSPDEAEAFARRFHRVGGWRNGKLEWRDLSYRMIKSGHAPQLKVVSLVHAEVVQDGKGGYNLALHEQHSTEADKSVPALVGPVAAFQEKEGILVVDCDKVGVQVRETHI